MIWINHKKVTTPGSWVPNMVVHDIEWLPVFPSFTRDSHQSRVSQDEPVVENFIYFSKIPVFYLFIYLSPMHELGHICAQMSLLDQDLHLRYTFSIGFPHFCAFGWQSYWHQFGSNEVPFEKPTTPILWQYYIMVFSM